MLHRCVTSIILGGMIVGCGPAGQFPVTGGSYSPVMVEDLVDKQCTNRTGQDDGNFTWKFSKDRFVLQGTDIPPDLLLVLLGEGAKAEKIEGTWDIDDNEMIHFQVETDQPEDKPREAKLKIFFTGVIRIQTDDAQYVF